ncbi:putative autophagy-related protein 11 [Clytia hemisphaerica]
MDLSKLKSKVEIGPLPNVVIFFETFHNALVQDFNKKIDDIGETWTETKDAIGNLKVASKEVLRVRGETARRIEERDYWKQLYEKEKAEKEEAYKRVDEIKNELLKVKEDKKVKNEYILINNENLVRKLHEERQLRLGLIDDMLDSRSFLNQAKMSQKKELLSDLREQCITDIEKMKLSTKTRKISLSPKKASFV